MQFKQRLINCKWTVKLTDKIELGLDAVQAKSKAKALQKYFSSFQDPFKVREHLIK